MGLIFLLLIIAVVIFIVVGAKGGLLGGTVDKIKNDPDNPLSKKIF